MDLEDNAGKEERFTESCREKEKEIWEELQDANWAREVFVYPYFVDPTQFLADIIAIVAEYKDKTGKLQPTVREAFDRILDKIDQEVEQFAEFEVNRGAK